jgi:precorrin-4/cobalt-precorrin-4 C11-methyltransferase
MAAAGITRTALIIVGPMLDDAPGSESRLYDETYSHIFRKTRTASGD